MAVGVARLRDGVMLTSRTSAVKVDDVNIEQANVPAPRVIA
jgi:hypothetical protein